MYKLINYLIICSVFHSGFTNPTLPLFKYDDDRFLHFFKKPTYELKNDSTNTIPPITAAVKPTTESVIYYPVIETYYPPPEYYSQVAVYPPIYSYEYQYPLPYLLPAEPYIIPAPENSVPVKLLVPSTKAPNSGKIKLPSESILDGVKINLTDKKREELTAKIIKLVKEYADNETDEADNDEYKGKIEKNEQRYGNTSSTWSDTANSPTTMKPKLDKYSSEMEPPITPSMPDKLDIRLLEDDTRSDLFENDFEILNIHTYISKDGKICKDQVIRRQKQTYKLIECEINNSVNDPGRGQTPTDKSNTTYFTEDLKSERDYNSTLKIYDKAFATQKN